MSQIFPLGTIENVEFEHEKQNCPRYKCVANRPGYDMAVRLKKICNLVHVKNIIDNMFDLSNAKNNIILCKICFFTMLFMV